MLASTVAYGRIALICGALAESWIVPLVRTRAASSHLKPSVARAIGRARKPGSRGRVVARPGSCAGRYSGGRPWVPGHAMHIATFRRGSPSPGRAGGVLDQRLVGGPVLGGEPGDGRADIAFGELGGHRAGGKPLPRGLNGTKPMPSSAQAPGWGRGSTASTRSGPPSLVYRVCPPDRCGFGQAEVAYAGLN